VTVDAAASATPATAARSAPSPPRRSSAARRGEWAVAGLTAREKREERGGASGDRIRIGGGG
jgi:hypothetical protein